MYIFLCVRIIFGVRGMGGRSPVYIPVLHVWCDELAMGRDPGGRDPGRRWWFPVIRWGEKCAEQTLHVFFTSQLGLSINDTQVSLTFLSCGNEKNTIPASLELFLHSLTLQYLSILLARNLKTTALLTIHFYSFLRFEHRNVTYCTKLCISYFSGRL